jgi:ubiquitin carboxyl-terminal hydrolase 25/28
MHVEIVSAYLLKTRLEKKTLILPNFFLTDLQDSPYTSFLEHTRKFLAGLQSASLPGIDDGVLGQLSDEQDGIRLEIDALRIRIDQLKNELEMLWRDCTEAAYELTSVFVHRGSSPSWGHYFFYSRHLPNSPDSWFKYNDSDVSVVSKDEVLADTTGSTANPYLVCSYQSSTVQ